MGNIIVSPGMSPIMPLVEQFNLHETNYMPPDDGPSQIIFFSKDLAFELYTNIPEPVTFVLAGLGGLAMLGFRRRRRS
jgi:MYXO-CTERM domain-containing protein